MRQSAANKLYADITEAAFTAQLIALARWHKWRVAHFRTAMNKRGRYMTPVQGDGAGWPDLVLLRADRLIFAELKSEHGRTTTVQDRWLTGLKVAKCEVYTWRPKDIEQIERILA